MSLLTASGGALSGAGCCFRVRFASCWLKRVTYLTMPFTQRVRSFRAQISDTRAEIQTEKQQTLAVSRSCLSFDLHSESDAQQAWRRLETCRGDTFYEVLL